MRTLAKHFLLTSLLLGVLFHAPSAFAISFSMIEVDQQQLTQDGAVVFGFPANQEQVAQVITVGTSGFLTTVRLPIRGQGDLNLEIQRVTDGLPDGKVLHAVTINDLFIPAQPGIIPFQSFELSKPFHISSGDQFAIVLNSSFPDSFTGVIAKGPVGDPYLGGDAFFLDNRVEELDNVLFWWQM